MASVQANNIQIEYETFGEKKNPALLLVIGLGGQLIHWQKEFCLQLAQNGYYVIRFDNRESGLSTRTQNLQLKDKAQIINQVFSGEFSVPFGIEDMANDAMGLLDALEIKKAHICGMSMGGFIAQTICVNHTSRVLSLTSIYSHTGDNAMFIPEKEVLEHIMGPSPEQPDAFVEDQMYFLKLTYGSGKPFDEKFHRNLAQTSVNRSFCVQGTLLQHLAILTQKDRTQDLEQLDIPALIIHGDDDPLIPVSGGIATSKAIKNSKLKILKGMGHIAPNLDAYWSEILDEMVLHLGTLPA